MKYRIRYFAPYTPANFECEASTLEEGQQKRDAHHEKIGWCVPNREIRSETLKG